MLGNDVDVVGTDSLLPVPWRMNDAPLNEAAYPENVDPFWSSKCNDFEQDAFRIRHAMPIPKELLTRKTYLPRDAANTLTKSPRRHYNSLHQRWPPLAAGRENHASANGSV
jgi:hypothetical protein